MLLGKGEALAFVQGDDENAGFRGRLEGFLDHRFRGSCSGLGSQPEATEGRFEVEPSHVCKKVRVVKVVRRRWWTLPMELSPGVGVDEVGGGIFSSLSVIVEVEGFLEKPARGPRWVSLSSGD